MVEIVGVSELSTVRTDDGPRIELDRCDGAEGTDAPADAAPIGKPDASDADALSECTDDGVRVPRAGDPVGGDPAGVETVGIADRVAPGPSPEANAPSGASPAASAGARACSGTARGVSCAGVKGPRVVSVIGVASGCIDSALGEKGPRTRSTVGVGNGIGPGRTALGVSGPAGTSKPRRRIATSDSVLGIVSVRGVATVAETGRACCIMDGMGGISMRGRGGPPGVPGCGIVGGRLGIVRSGGASDTVRRIGMAGVVSDGAYVRGGLSAARGGATRSDAGAAAG